MKTVQLAIEEIQIDQTRQRTRLADEGLEQLAASITAVGVLHPVIVQCASKGYRLVAGLRRIAACQVLGMKSVPAVVMGDHVSPRQIQLVENLQREDLNPVERAHAVDSFIKEECLKKSEAARRLGIPRTTLNDWLAVLDVGPRYQNAVLNNHAGGSSALTASHIPLCRRFAERLNSPGMLEVALDAVLYYGLTRAETKRVLKIAANRTDVSIERAIRTMRLLPRETDHGELEDWDVEQLVTYLTRSGDYLMKCQPADLWSIGTRERSELVRQSKALQRLLQEIVELLAGEDIHQVS